MYIYIYIYMSIYVYIYIYIFMFSATHTKPAHISLFRCVTFVYCGFVHCCSERCISFCGSGCFYYHLIVYMLPHAPPTSPNLCCVFPHLHPDYEPTRRNIRKKPSHVFSTTCMVRELFVSRFTSTLESFL